MAISLDVLCLHDSVNIIGGYIGVGSHDLVIGGYIGVGSHDLVIGGYMGVKVGPILW